MFVAPKETQVKDGFSVESIVFRYIELLFGIAGQRVSIDKNVLKFKLVCAKDHNMFRGKLFLDSS